MSKQLHNKTKASEGDLRKTVDRLNRERRSFLSKFADQKARVFRRFNQIKVDRNTARLRMREALEGADLARPASADFRPTSPGIIRLESRPSTAEGGGVAWGSPNSGSGLQGLECWFLEQGGSTTPGGQPGTTADLGVGPDGPTDLHGSDSSPGIEIEADRDQTDQWTEGGLFVTELCSSERNHQGQRRHFLLSIPDDDSNFRLGQKELSQHSQHSLSRSLNALDWTETTRPRSSGGFHSNSDELLSRDRARPMTVTGGRCRDSMNNGGSMRKSSSLTLPSIESEGGSLIGNSPQLSPSYKSGSNNMAALQLSPRVDRTTTYDQSGLNFDYGTRTGAVGPLNNKSANHKSDLSGDRAQAGITRTMAASGPGSDIIGAGLSGNCGGGTVGGRAAGQSGQSETSPGVQRKAIAGSAGGPIPLSNTSPTTSTANLLLHQSPSPRRRSPCKGSPNTSTNSSRDPSPSITIGSTSPGRLSPERRISLAMAKALGTEGRSGLSGHKTKEELDFYRRALSGSKLPVSPTDIRSRSQTYSSGDEKTLKKKAAQAAAAKKAKKTTAPKHSIATSPGPKPSRKPCSSNDKNSNCSIPKVTVNDVADTIDLSKLDLGTNGKLLGQRQEQVQGLGVEKVEVMEEIEICDLGEDWQLNAIPFRQRSVTFGGLGSKPIRRLPGIIERSPTPDTAASRGNVTP